MKKERKETKKKSKSLKVKRVSKKKVSERVPTGIIGFDKLIEGGFERNSTNLIVGGLGSGKTILATQIALGGMKKGEKCLYVTFEENKEEFYKNMIKFGWDLEELERKNLFTFLQYSPIKVKTMLEEGGGAIESVIVDKKIQRVIIDSINSFTLLFEDERSKREAALSLFNTISGWKCTSFITVEEESLGYYSRNSENVLGFEADSIIMIHYLRAKSAERERFIEIIKMRGTEHSRKIHKMTISKQGIKVETKPSKISLNA
jgi:circadian clock protein KaiC